MNWAFPIEADEFIQYQEKLCGRSLNDRESEMTLEAVDIINEAYEDGKAGFSTGLYPRNPDDFLNEAISQVNPDLGSKRHVRRYMLALVSLSTAAWERGCKDAEKAVSA